MGSREGLTLREKALEALEKSTKMLQAALDLLTQGKRDRGGTGAQGSAKAAYYFDSTDGRSEQSGDEP